MDPATIATSMVTILGPYVSKAGEAFAKKVGEVAVDKAEKMLGWLKQKFAGDPSATKDLTRFEQDPKAFESGLKAAIQEKAEADPAFAQEAAQRVADIGPVISVFQDIAEGRIVIGVDAEQIKRGNITVDQKVGKADETTAVRAKTIG
jgi:hypothetical protein